MKNVTKEDVARCRARIEKMNSTELEGLKAELVRHGYKTDGDLAETLAIYSKNASGSVVFSLLIVVAAIAFLIWMFVV